MCGFNLTAIAYSRYITDETVTLVEQLLCNPALKLISMDTDFLLNG